MAEKVIYQYQLPDGSILKLEGEEGQEAKADAEAKRIIATEFAQQTTPVPQPTPQQAPQTLGDVGKDIARSAVKGGATGVMTLPALPSMATQGMTALMDYLGMPKPDPRISFINPMLPGLSFKPTFQQVQQAVETIPGAEAVTQYQPQTKAGEYFESIGEFVAPGLPFAKPFTRAGRGQRALNVVAPGVAAGVVSEATEDLPPYVSIPATIAAGGITALYTRPSQAARIAEKAMKDVSKEELQLAKEIQKIAVEEFDIPITAAEIIENGLVNKLGSIVYKSEEGGPIMYNFLKNRPEQVSFIAKQLTNKLLEEPKYLKDAMGDIKVTAETALKNARKERRKKAKKAGYTVANTESLQANQVLPIIRYIDDTLKRLDADDPARITLNSLKRALIKSKTSKKDQPQILDELGNPIRGQQPEIIITPQTNINTLDNILKRFNERITDSKIGIVPQRNIIDSSTERILREGLDEGGEGALTILEKQLRTNKNYSAAKDEFERLSQELVAPIERNLGALLKGDITQGKVRSIVFDTSTRNVNDIKRTYEVLNKTDPQAFPLIARTYFKHSMNETLDAAKKGDLKLDRGFNLQGMLIGKGREDNFEAMLEGVAKAKGVNPETYKQGFLNFNKVLKRIGNITSPNNPGAPPDFSLLTRDFAQIGAFQWKVKFASKFEARVRKKTLEELANIFTQDNSVELLEALAKTNPNSMQATNLVRRILYVTNNIQNDPMLEQSLQTQERMEQAVPQ
jgi:hypothetical protein